jgi:hypothetical protein
MVSYMVIIKNEHDYSYSEFTDTRIMYDYLRKIVFDKIEIFRII